MIKTKILFFFIISMILFGCPEKFIESDSTIIIKNKSKKNIYFHEKGSLPIYVWPPHKNYFIPIQGIFKLEGNFVDSHSDGSKIHIWLFDRDVVENNEWKNIVKNKMYLIRYDLTLKELKAMNWTIIYTGK